MTDQTTAHSWWQTHPQADPKTTKTEHPPSAPPAELQPPPPAVRRRADVPTRQNSRSSAAAVPAAPAIPSGRAAATRNTPLHRRLLVSAIFSLGNLLAWVFSEGAPPADRFGPTAAEWWATAPEPEDRNRLHSGVGLVTKDGLWPEESRSGEYRGADIKILGFTDRNYLPIAKVWYTRMSLLGYTEHWLVAHDEMSYDSLIANDFRVFKCFIKDPEIDKPVQGLWQQIMGARLQFTQELLRNGTHLLITDIDNVFSRHVPLYGFLEEGYDVYHAYEMRYPVPVFDEFGFVVCSGHQFLRSSPETLRFLDLVLKRCPGPKGRQKCDDQVVYNIVFHKDLHIKWDNVDNPNHDGALRINSTHGKNIAADVENVDLLVESFTGRSPVTNHTIKLWDRDFAWRLAGHSRSTRGGAIPYNCPSSNNWLGMPTKLGGGDNKIRSKILGFEVWDNDCRHTELLGLGIEHVLETARQST